MRSHTDVASRNVTDGIDDGPGAGDSALTGGMLFPCRRVGAAASEIAGGDRNDGRRAYRAAAAAANTGAAPEAGTGWRAGLGV